MTRAKTDSGQLRAAEYNFWEAGRLRKFSGQSIRFPKISRFQTSHRLTDYIKFKKADTNSYLCRVTHEAMYLIFF